MNNLAIKTLKCGVRKRILKNFSSYTQSNQIVKPVLHQQKQGEKIGPLGWMLLTIPASTFALGTWQVQRKKWKEGLIADLKARTQADPVPLPENLDDVEELEYKPVHVRGQFLHEKELYVGPRSLLIKGDASTESTLMTSRTQRNQGYLVITPFKLADRDQIILINRGWVPAKNKNPKTRQKGQIQGEVDVVGIVRKQENRPVFTPKNSPETNQWFHRDVDEMAKIVGSSTIFLDATNDFDVPEGPIGGQTRITLRNEHLSYVFTWYSLCAFTSFLWYQKFLKK